MPDDNRDKWRELPEITINNRKLVKHARKIETATVKHAHRFIIKRWGNVVEVRRHVTTWILIMAVLVGATGLQLMWVRHNFISSAGASGGIYAEAVLGPVETLNPIYARTSAEKSASDLMFSKIMRYDTTGHLNYDLATNVAVDGTGTIYTVSIRPDAKWHDGAKVTASDIVYSINLIKNFSARSTITGWNDVSIKLINDLTVEFTLKSAYVAFEHALTFPILPEHRLSKISPANIRENIFSQKPIGSGPFKFAYTQDVNASTGEKVIYLSRNADYYGGPAKLATFRLNVYSSSEAILSALSKNVVNAATDISPIDIGRVDKNHLTVVDVPVQSGVYAILNTTSSILADVNIRRALQIGTDTVAVRKEFPINPPSLELPFTNGQLSTAVPTAPAFDSNGAKKILEDNGWKVNDKGIRVKDGKELSLNIVTIKSNEFERVLEVLAGQWRALGINPVTQVVDPQDPSQNVAQSILQPRAYDVLLYRLDIGADPDTFAYWHSSQISTLGLNFANYSNLVSDDALLSARGKIDPSLRNTKYVTFAAQWLSDVPAIGLYQTTMQYASSKTVQSFDLENKLVYPENRYSDVLNWTTGSKTVYKTP